ncbi:MAG TPA: outer membrane protein assembly factor BamE [Alphaproteobacteria bacterium]|nr:outer membrane protein assembly factor BamE [Alphaproteobacteria bacterium]
MSKTLKNILLSTAIAALLGTAACESDVAARGNIPKPDKLAEVQPGATRDQVLQAIGSPTSYATFDPNIWYYVGQLTEDYAFFQTKVLDRKVVAITFGPDGRVAEIQNLSKDDSQNVQMVSRTTPTVGRDISLWNQLFSNLGRGAAIPGATSGSGTDSGL